jgi:S1-C subfamily serine protease
MSSTSILTTISEGLADAVASAAPSVVQVQGRRRPASGVVFADQVVMTSTRALGREDGLHIRRHDGAACDAELAGWDPATGIAVLRAAGLGAPPIQPSLVPPRVGHLALAIARSWSNAVTASAGLVAVIGGPLSTGRRYSIDEVIRTTAPIHDGFAGGAFINTDGALIGMTTPASIRGLVVVIPTRIAWKTVQSLLEHGRLTRGYLGIAGQPAQLSTPQRQVEDRQGALLVVGVTAGSPAGTGGLLVGDLLLDMDGQLVGSAEDLLDLLSSDRIGRPVTLRVLRGTTVVTIAVVIGQRPEG